MTWMIAGLVWLSLSAVTGLIVGLTIHRADVRDDHVPATAPRAASAADGVAPPRGRGRGREMVAAVRRANHSHGTHRRRPPTTPPAGTSPGQRPPA